MDWAIEEKGFDKKNIEFFGSKFCIGNGYFGYRGTLEEFQKEQLPSCTVSEVFDDNGNGWREPVNMPNGLFTKLSYKGKELSVLSSEVAEHKQILELDGGIHKRETLFVTEDGKKIKVKAERVASLSNIHMLIMRYEVSANEDISLELLTKIDENVWDINGPHFRERKVMKSNDVSGLTLVTGEVGAKIAVAQKVKFIKGNIENVESDLDQVKVNINISVKKNEPFVMEKYIAICKETDCEDVFNSAVLNCEKSVDIGYEKLLLEQRLMWKERYCNLGIKIQGDDEAQKAIYYSCYLLLSSAPFHTDKVAIPARGLSGQVYKGAMFWDTEIYMMPMFAFCEPKVARNLMKYRTSNLNEAIEKAKEYGYRGAFYPWESQENGKDGCTHYNLTDIFTGRKMRTYFRDKQIHISADVAYGLWKYINITKDYEFLLDGAAEAILECARFFYSYSYFKKEKNRYEFLDVTGADEYHERINNDAYTNYMIKHTAKIALDVMEYMKINYNQAYEELMTKLDYFDDIKNIKDMYELIYIPSPNEEGIIEQFDGYFKEEDLSIEELYSRIIKPNEYLGSPCGLAVNTQIIKQADIILLLSILGEGFNEDIKANNWDYYEPRTEHGSSLSTCIYAFLAAQIGKTDWAYKYLLKSARIDLEGNYKLYLGDLYIGGTHPAANGGTWMVTVQGFGGLTALENGVAINPHLPKKWDRLSYNFAYAEGKYSVNITKKEIIVKEIGDKKNDITIKVGCKEHICRANETLIIEYN